MLTKQDLKAIAGLLKKQKEEILDEVDVRIDKKLQAQTEEILKGVANFMHDALLPLLDNHERRITRLEKHTNHPPISL